MSVTKQKIEIICEYCGRKERVRRVSSSNACFDCNAVRQNTKAFAHRKVYQAVKNGLLPSLKDSDIKCVDCGDIAECYDHRDYAKPLDVDPVCNSCDKYRGKGLNDYDPMCLIRLKKRRSKFNKARKIHKETGQPMDKILKELRSA